MYSMIPKTMEKTKKELIFFFVLKTKKSNEINPQNIAKKAGIKNIVNGIKNLKSLSNVNEIDIQYKLVIK